MNGYSPKLPLTRDPVDGFRLTKNLKEMVQQNFKMLILTSPGERIMEPTFGVGLYNYLFELDTMFVESEIRDRIARQTRKYMPFVNILSIGFGNRSPNAEVDRSFLSIVIRYRIPSLREVNVLRIKLD
tara:strand:- start:1391 stop:1774 length:384 start_codon:yes stop_codon:yes gene_type:complete